MSLRVLELHGTDPRRWGEQHGESFKDDIKAIADIRMALTLGRTKIAHTQPRRIAARTIAERISEELGEALGGIVGYRVRAQSRHRAMAVVLAAALA